MPAIPPQEHKLRILKIIDETPDTKTFRVEKQNITFYPGQFFMVRFPENEAFRRAYSISSSPAQKDYIGITMNLVGQFTKKLWQSKVGDYLLFKGPYGKFYFDEKMGNDLILIGGGLGISPLMSIIRDCTDKKLKNKINLVYSIRTPRDIICMDELKKIRQENDKFNYTITITRPHDKDAWAGKTGRIGSDLLKNNITDIGGSLYFICGPLGFAKSAISILESLGAKKEQFKTDIWGE